MGLLAKSIQSEVMAFGGEAKQRKVSKKKKKKNENMIIPWGNFKNISHFEIVPFCRSIGSKLNCKQHTSMSASFKKNKIPLTHKESKYYLSVVAKTG